MRESRITRRTLDELRRRGWWATKIAASPFQMAGLPDILVALRRPPGRGHWVEMKRPGERPTRLQLATHRALRAAGFAVTVATSVEEAVEAVERSEEC